MCRHQCPERPSAHAEQGIPANYLALYRHAGREYGIPWPVLAGIGSIETDHGRRQAPGVRSGVNSFGCCAGPMQFNTRDGPPSTWDRYGVDGNHAPRAFRPLPAWAMAAGRAPQLVDARIHDNVIWVLRRYHLSVTAARESGHQTHGDGTAVDLIPADGATQPVWDASAGRLARHLGWTPGCVRSGTRPACPLAPAIQFVGYDGYPNHGSPRTCTGTCPAHIHISWASGCYGSSALSPPCHWVSAFPAPPSVGTAGRRALS